MAEEEDSHERFDAFLEDYCRNVREGLSGRWEAHAPEIYANEVSECIAGLAARQATLAIEIARNPGVWNPHVAPILLRCMTDVHITMAWVAEDPESRAREYVRFGIGQEKLFIEYLENERDSAPEGELDEEVEQMIEARRSWMESQIAEWAIEVNVGSWSGVSTREMAQQSGCEGLYKFAYVPFSGACHSMWQHVGLFNVVHCDNPLHKHHRVPMIPVFELDPDYLYRSAKYVSRTYQLLDSSWGVEATVPLPVAFFVENHPFRMGREESG